MTFGSRPHKDHPGSPLYGSRPVSSGSHSFLRRLTSFGKRPKSQTLVASPSYTTIRSSPPTPPLSPPSSSSSAPNRLAVAAARTASLKATVNTGLLTPPSTARPVSSSTRPPSCAKTSARGTSSSAFSSTASVTCNAPLVVQVEIRFPGLTGFRSTPSYFHEYASSHNLQVSNRLCNGLLGRLTHCSTELITRRDSEALVQEQPHRHSASAKQLSYELHFRILRKDFGVWAEKTFCSYQKQEISCHDAYEVILATHRMIGLFMRRHDPAFRWSDTPTTQIPFLVPRPEVSELVSHTVGRPLPLSCIPHPRFLDDSQCFEFVPGYAIKLSFRSRCHARKQYEWKRTISLQSNQSAPLNLAHAEDLLWQTFESVNSALSIRRQAFNDEHKACEALEGIVDCQHFDEDALDIELKIQNNLGPNYTHLTRSIHSRLALFRHVDGADCQEFIHNVHSHFLKSRETADTHARSLPDFDYRITTLETSTRSVDNPARFVLDASSSYSRASIEAVLDRVETGIYDVLRNKGCTIHVVAYKRGHLILDKSIAASYARPKPSLFPQAPADEDTDVIIASLKERIHQDINAVCKDTCSLDPPDDVDNLSEAAAEARSANIVILEEPSMIDDEPVVPAPRVVELPAGVYLGDSRPSSTEGSPRRRAFPLVPEKFVLPPSPESSPGSSTPLTTKEAALELPIVEAVASAPEPTVIEPAGILAETHAEIMRDMADPAPSEPSSEDEKPLAKAPITAEESQALNEARHEILGECQNPIEALAYREEIATERSTQASTRAFTEVRSEPSADQGIALSEEEFSVDGAPDREEPEQEPVTEHAIPQISPAEATILVIPAVEDKSYAPCYENISDINEAENSISEDNKNTSTSLQPPESHLPEAFLSFDGDSDDGDSESQPDERAHEEVRDASSDSTASFYSFDDCERPSTVEMQFEPESSPIAESQLDNIFKSDDETSSEFHIYFPAYDQGLPDVPSSEFSLDLPAYHQGLPNLPSTDDVQAINTPGEFSGISENESPDRFGVPAGSDDELGELGFVSQPVFDEHIITAAEVDDSDGSEFSDDEPLTFSSPSRKSRANPLTGTASIPDVGSSDLARPATPSLSTSSRGFNSPETNYLETPKFSRDSYPAMITCFDPDNNTSFGHSYGANGESEPDLHFAAFVREHKPVAETSVAVIALDRDLPLDQPPATPISPTVCENSESDSTATEICHKAHEALTDFAVADAHFRPELDFQVPTSYLAPEPDTSFEDFAMTKPDIDMDMLTDAATDELDSEIGKQLEEPQTCPTMIPHPASDDKVETSQSTEETTHEDTLSNKYLFISMSPKFQPAMLSDFAEDDLVTFEQAVLGSVVAEAEVAAEIESVPATGTTSRPEEPVQAETLTTSPSDDLVDKFYHEEVDELALSGDGAPPDDTSMFSDELVEPEVPTLRWGDLMGSEAEALLVTATPVLDENSLAKQDLYVSDIVVEAPSTTVAVLEASIAGNAAKDESPVTNDPSTHHPISDANSPQSCLHVSEATSVTDGSFGLCQLGVLPTPPESEDELDVLDHVGVISEHTDPVADLCAISSEEEENKTPTQAAASPDSSEKMAHISTTVTSNDTTYDMMTDMPEPPRENTDIPDNITPSQPQEDLFSCIDALDLSSPSVEEPLTAVEHTLASEDFTPELLPRAVEEIQLENAQLEETNDIGITGEVKTTAPVQFTRCSASWFLPKDGTVGLDESKLVRVGLRGALTGSHAFDSISSPHSDLHAQNTQPAIDDDTDILSTDEDLEDTIAKQEELSVPKQVEETLPVSSTAVAELPQTPTSTTTEDQAAPNQDVALPRMIMAFAGMAVMSRIINQATSN